MNFGHFLECFELKAIFKSECPLYIIFNMDKANKGKRIFSAAQIG